MMTMEIEVIGNDRPERHSCWQLLRNGFAEIAKIMATAYIHSLRSQRSVSQVIDDDNGLRPRILEVNGKSRIHFGTAR
jgi:hypothetical protein